MHVLQPVQGAYAVRISDDMTDGKTTNVSKREEAAGEKCSSLTEYVKLNLIDKERLGS